MLHAALIDEIDGAATKTDDKIRFHTRRVEEVRRKDSCKCTCGELPTQRVGISCKNEVSVLNANLTYSIATFTSNPSTHTLWLLLGYYAITVPLCIPLLIPLCIPHTASLHAQLVYYPPPTHTHTHYSSGVYHSPAVTGHYCHCSRTLRGKGIARSNIVCVCVFVCAIISKCSLYCVYPCHYSVDVDLMGIECTWKRAC